MMGTDGENKNGDAEGLQFDKVELAEPAGATVCGRCARPIVDQYFEVGGTMVCGACSAELGDGKKSPAAILRALALGGAAALLGTIVWFAIIKLTDREFGLLAIGVGLLVGYAVRKGSRALGGWKYQALAMALTYASITASNVPLLLQAFAANAAKQANADQAKTEAGDTPDNSPAPGQPASADTSVPASKPAPVGAGGMALGFLLLFALALASPFLQGADNIIGILIIGFALYEAWKINRRIPINGPFRLGQAAEPTPAVVPPAAPPPVVPIT
jgi:hypothetical protein